MALVKICKECDELLRGKIDKYCSWSPLMNEYTKSEKEELWKNVSDRYKVLCPKCKKMVPFDSFWRITNSDSLGE